jgi:N-acetylglucosamine kinase-like BadF-type ATPase
MSSTGQDSVARGPEVLLGVEGGGTTTQAVVADRNGKIIGRGLGPNCNHRKVGFDAASKALRTAIEGALGQVVGHQRTSEGPVWQRVNVAAACLGLAGIDTPEDRERISSWIRRENITPRSQVVNDSELILSGGTPEGWGVALISGIGSICIGRTRDGRTARVGGWGHLFGDEGSGYQLALDALRLASQTADGRASANGVLKGILSYWRLSSAEDLISKVYKPETTGEEIAQLAITVQELANRGDAEAVALVDRGGEALAAHVDTVVRKLDLRQPPLALGGAALRASLKKSLLAHIKVEMGPVSLVQDPAQAAVTMAQRLLQAPARP